PESSQDEDGTSNTGEPEKPDSNSPQDEDDVIGTASIKISAEKIGKGTLASNSAINIKENDNGAALVHRFLNENNISYDNSGSINSSFYLQRIYIQGINENVNISEDLLANLESKNLDVDFDVHDVHSLGEFDYTSNSGWVYSVNDVHMNYGFSDYTVEDGDQISIRFILDYKD